MFEFWLSDGSKKGNGKKKGSCTISLRYIRILYNLPNSQLDSLYSKKITLLFPLLAEIAAWNYDIQYKMVNSRKLISHFSLISF